MSTTPLSNTQELIERSIYEKIRSECVDKGYIPDITTLVNPLNSAAGQAEWDGLLSTIKTNMGFSIELFNNSNSEKLGSLKVPRIVINSDSFLDGELGGDSTKIFRVVGDGYSAYQQPPQTVNYYFNVRIVANNVKEERILTAILSLALPKRGYVPYYTDPTSSFFCRNISVADISNEDNGFISKYFAYEVQDAWMMEDIEIETGIAKIQEITIQPQVQKYEDGDIQHDTDVLSITAT